jgi:magnesium-transporting ATPase (P-type)
MFKVIDKDGKFKDVASKDIHVGDLLFIECDKVFPADLVVLATALPEGLCFIETAQLDGY